MKRLSILLLMWAFVLVGFAQQQPSAEAQQWYKKGAELGNAWCLKRIQEIG